MLKNRKNYKKKKFLLLSFKNNILRFVNDL